MVNFQRHWGSITIVYYNIASSLHTCQNPADAMLGLFDTLKPHLKKILGPYHGGFEG